MRGLYKNVKDAESGQSVVIVAIALVVLLGFAAFAVDIGYAAHQKSVLQNAADSAALAVAMSIPSSTDDAVKNKVTEYATVNMKDPVTIDVITIDRIRNTVQVSLSQETPKFFAALISSDVKVMAASATAKVWAGEALPFINVDDHFKIGDTISLWDKQQFGDFERLLADYSKDDTECTVHYDGGVFFDEGVVANVKPFVEYCYEQGQDVYVFSLRDDLIVTPVDKINNKQLFAQDDLVLLQIHITAITLNGNHRGIEVEVVDIIPEFWKNLPNARAYSDSKAILID